MQLDVLWYFLSSISLGARLSGIPGRWWCSVGLSLPLICSHTADSQGACHRGRGERGLKCSARYSKRCLINNVSDRTRWDTAGLLCLSQVHTHTHTHTFGKRLIKPHPYASSTEAPAQRSSQYSDIEAGKSDEGNRHQALNTCVRCTVDESSILLKPRTYIYVHTYQQQTGAEHSWFFWALFSLHEFS